MKTQLWAIILVLLANLIGSFGPIYLKKASSNFRFNIKKILANFQLWFGLSFYGIGTVLFIIALKGGEISVLYPLVGTIYIWVSFLSIKMLGEKMSFYKWLGVFLIILGVSFIGFS